MTGVAARDVPLRRARRSSATSGPTRVGQDPPVEGAARCGRSRTRCPAPYQFRAAGDLATEIEWAKNRRIPPERYLAALGEHEPPIPADLMLRVYRRVRGAQGGSGADRLRGSARARDPGSSTTSTARRRAPRALPRVHGRRVPGRQPAAADAARPVARRRATTSASSATTTSRSTGSPARRPSTCSACRSASRTRRCPAGGELPLDAAGARAREPARAEARRRREDAARDASRTARSRRCGRSRRRRPRPRSWSSGSARAGVPARGDRDPLPHERAAGRLRGGAARGRGIPYQGAALLAREAARRVLRALEPSAPAADGVRTLALERGWLPKPGPRSSASASWRARPTSRGSSGSPRSSAASTARTSAPSSSAASATGRTPAAASTCSPTTAPRASSSRSVLLPAARGEGAAVASRRARPAAIAEERRLFYVGLTRAKRHPGRHLGAEAEPLPRRADARGGTARRADAREASRR